MRCMIELLAAGLLGVFLGADLPERQQLFEAVDATHGCQLLKRFCFSGQSPHGEGAGDRNPQPKALGLTLGKELSRAIEVQTSTCLRVLFLDRLQ